MHDMDEFCFNDSSVQPGSKGLLLMLRATLLLLAALLIAAPLAQAETLASSSYRLEAGGIRVAADPVLSSASGTLHIQGAVLGQVEAGRSTGPSGLSLQGGLLPVPVPEPGTSLLVSAGASALIGLRRLRARRPVSSCSTLSEECSSCSIAAARS